MLKFSLASGADPEGARGTMPPQWELISKMIVSNCYSLSNIFSYMVHYLKKTSLGTYSKGYLSTLKAVASRGSAPEPRWGLTSSPPPAGFIRGASPPTPLLSPPRSAEICPIFSDKKIFFGTQMTPPTMKISGSALVLRTSKNP